MRIRELIATYETRAGADAAAVRDALKAFWRDPLGDAGDAVVIALYTLQQLWAVGTSDASIAAAERFVAECWRDYRRPTGATDQH
jgi:hypothetical protein